MYILDISAFYCTQVLTVCIVLDPNYIVPICREAHNVVTIYRYLYSYYI